MKNNKVWAFSLCAVPQFCLAGVSQGDALSTVLSGLISLLTSTPARLLAVIAIIGIGYSTIALGTIPKSRAITTVVGLGLVFGASFIMQDLGLGA